METARVRLVSWGFRERNCTGAFVSTESVEPGDESQSVTVRIANAADAVERVTEAPATPFAA